MWRLPLLMACAACGSSTQTASVAQPEPEQSQARATAAPASVDTMPEKRPDKFGIELKPSPIEIPNARLYKGFVLGGLPSEKQFDAALAADFESAMSVMANREKEGLKIARYASSIGVRYLHFAIDGPEELTEATAWEFAATLSMLDKPAIIHSARGRRVGAIFALMAFFVDELPAEEAYAIGVATGMGDFGDRVRKLLELPPQ